MQKGMYLRTPEVNKLDYDGSCAPCQIGSNCNTFSVGIFQWLPKLSGKGLKRSSVIKRIRGLTSDPKAVYDQAEDWIKKNSDHAGYYRQPALF